MQTQMGSQKVEHTHLELRSKAQVLTNTEMDKNSFGDIVGT